MVCYLDLCRCRPLPMKVCRISVLLVKKYLDKTTKSELICHLPLSAVIPDYPEDGSFFVRKCYTWKGCCHSWSELITYSGEIGPRSRPYQTEAFEPSGPSLVFFLGWVQNLFVFAFFTQPPSPSRRRVLNQDGNGPGQFLGPTWLIGSSWPYQSSDSVGCTQQRKEERKTTSINLTRDWQFQIVDAWPLARSWGNPGTVAIPQYWFNKAKQHFAAEGMAANLFLKRFAFFLKKTQRVFGTRLEPQAGWPKRLALVRATLHALQNSTLLVLDCFKLPEQSFHVWRFLDKIAPSFG